MVDDKMDAGLTIGIAILTFVIGLIIKYVTGFGFNKFIGALGALTIIFPMIIATINIMNDPSNPDVTKDNIEFFITSFINALPGVIIGDIAVALVTGFLDALGIKY